MALPSTKPNQQIHEEDHQSTTITINHSQQQSSPQPNITYQKPKTKTKHYTLLLSITYTCLFIGSISSALVSKFYFNHKGSNLWISTWVQCAGFPLLLFPAYLPFYVLKTTERRPFTGFTPKITFLSIVVGALLGLNNFLFSLGNSHLPMSTSSLILSSQLAFNLILSVIIVKQKVTFNNLNCVVLLTLSSILLALNSSHDRPHGLTHVKYLVGFFATLGAGLLFALYLPIMEVIYKQVYCYAMVVEMQLVMEIAATVFATIGMAADGGFSAFKTESLAFDKGPVLYWVTVMGNVVTWQLCFMGTAGMVFLTTSLTSGVCMTALMGINVLGGVAVYRDKFSGGKAVSTLLCFWGFCSYLYGIYRKNKEMERLRDQSIRMKEITMTQDYIA